MLHPSVRLILWGAATVYAQTLEGTELAAVAAVVLAGALLTAPVRLYALLRRARWLLLSIAVLFSFATPGEALLPALGSASPTLDGIQLGCTHLARLAVVLALLAALLHFTAGEQLVSALHGLLRPMAALGLPRDRIAVRLMLVLRYVDAHGGRRMPSSWRQWIAPPTDVACDAPLAIRVFPLRFADFAVLIGLLAAGLWTLSR